jgi:hypothetical protein
MCIAVWSPGNAITVEFLSEQIWLEGTFGSVEPTEVYDLLISSDDEPVSELFALFPNSLGSEGLEGGSLQCGLPGLHDDEWGWMYLPGGHDDGNERTLVVRDPASGARQNLVGTVGSAKPVWHPQLNGPDERQALRDIKKAVFQISLDPPIPVISSGAVRGRWIRIIARPRVLDVQTRPMQLRDEHGKPGGQFRWNLPILCPALVLQEVEATIHGAFEREPRQDAHFLIREHLVDGGFRREGTTVRVDDHRILVGSADPELRVTPLPCAEYDQVTFVGSQDRSVDIHATRRSAETSEWLGGSRRNESRDLCLAAKMVFNYALYKPDLVKEQLVFEAVGERHRVASMLVDVMCDVELLRKSRGDGSPQNPFRYRAFCDQRESSDPSVEDDLRTRLVRLRRAYLDPDRFNGFPEAQQAYSDLHRFRIPIQVDWFNEDRLPYWRTRSGKRLRRWSVLVISGIGAIAGLTALALEWLG